MYSVFWIVVEFDQTPHNFLQLFVCDGKVIMNFELSTVEFEFAQTQPTFMKI